MGGKFILSLAYTDYLYYLLFSLCLIIIFKFYYTSLLFPLLSIKQYKQMYGSVYLGLLLQNWIYITYSLMQDIQRKAICIRLAKCVWAKSKKDTAHQGQRSTKSKKNSSIDIKKICRQQSYHSVDRAKHNKKYHIKTSKNSKADFDINNLYYFQIPAASRYKRRGSYKLSKNDIQKSPLFSLLENTSQSHSAILNKCKKGNSFLSTSCSRKQGIKKQPNCERQQDLTQMMIRSSLLLLRYRSKCQGLQKENSEIKRKYSLLQKKVRALKKNKCIDLISFF